MIMTIGRYRGKTLEEIAYPNGKLDKRGLLYLDWLLGQDWFIKKYRRHAKLIGEYLAQPDVAQDLNQLVR